MDTPYESTSLGQGTTQGSKEQRDTMIDEEIMFIGTMVAVGYGGGSGNIPISEGYLNNPAPMFMEGWTISLTKGTLDPALDPRYGVKNAS
jgi:hypothetical protein